MTWPKGLQNGKHVLSRGLHGDSAQAEELIELAIAKTCRSSVDHTFLFNPAVAHIKELVVGGVLGRSTITIRLESTGLFQHDVNVIWIWRLTIWPSSTI